MKNVIRYGLLLGAAIVIGAGVAVAQMGEPREPQLPGEPPSAASRGRFADRFLAQFDLNHDGKLTPDEWERLAKIDRLFLTANLAYYDVDKKGYVTLQEFVDRPNPAFTELDKNKTCVLETHQLRDSLVTDPKKSNPGMSNIPNPTGH